MKLFLKIFEGKQFEIDVKLKYTVGDIKKLIETKLGADTYPAAQQVLIHQGIVLQDGTTVEDSDLAESSLLVFGLTKAPQASGPPPTSVPMPAVQPPAAAPAPAPAANALPDIYDQAASSLVASYNLEGSINQILEMGGGTWDRDTVVRALHAAFKRAVEHLYSGIPETAEAPPAPVPAANAPAQLQEAAQSAPVHASEGGDSNIRNEAMPQAVTITPKEYEAIERKSPQQICFEDLTKLKKRHDEGINTLALLKSWIHERKTTLMNQEALLVTTAKQVNALRALPDFDGYVYHRDFNWENFPNKSMDQIEKELPGKYMIRIVEDISE